jgi:hypothetical protein
VSVDFINGQQSLVSDAIAVLKLVVVVVGICSGLQVISPHSRSRELGNLNHVMLKVGLSTNTKTSGDRRN